MPTVLVVSFKALNHLIQEQRTKVHFITLLAAATGGYIIAGNNTNYIKTRI